MNAAVAAVNRWADAWLGVMGAVLWQSALLVGLVALIAWWLRGSSPVVRYWLWQIVAVKLLLMPFWTAAIPLPWWIQTAPPRPPAQAPSQASPGDDPEPPAPRHLSLTERGVPQIASRPATLYEFARQVTWQAWLLFVWSAIVLMAVVRLVAQRVRLAKLFKDSIPADEDVAALVAELAGQLGLRRVPTAVCVAGDCPLFVCGHWRPRLVLPGSLMNSLSPAERRQVILHELGHIKRHDLAWGWPVQITRMVYFFNPLVYWVGHQLRLERELACDQLAMAVGTHAPADYARTLVRVVSPASQPAAAATAAISSGLAGGEAPPELRPHGNSS